MWVLIEKRVNENFFLNSFEFFGFAFEKEEKFKSSDFFMFFDVLNYDVSLQWFE